ncbi:hypothetical protein MASR2M15_04710 [Anaerolineales bacterium]
MSIKPIHYVTRIEPVLEVTLYGYAQTQVWYPYLEDEEIDTQNLHEKIDIIISIVASKYMGIRFREFSISVKLDANRYFLAHAYNSMRLFAYMERAFFQTPYYHGDIEIQADAVRLSHQQNTVFEARLPQKAMRLKTGEECEELNILLPKRLRKTASQPHFFDARLEGLTETYSGDAVDLQMTPRADDFILNLLQESLFQVQEWRIRRTARHSKSKTYSKLNQT